MIALRWTVQPFSPVWVAAVLQRVERQTARLSQPLLQFHGDREAFITVTAAVAAYPIDVRLPRHRLF